MALQDLNCSFQPQILLETAKTMCKPYQLIFILLALPKF